MRRASEFPTRSREGLVLSGNDGRSGWEAGWGALDALLQLDAGRGCRQEGGWAQGAGSEVLRLLVSACGGMGAQEGGGWVAPPASLCLLTWAPCSPHAEPWPH